MRALSACAARKLVRWRHGSVCAISIRSSQETRVARNLFNTMPAYPQMSPTSEPSGVADHALRVTPNEAKLGADNPGARHIADPRPHDRDARDSLPPSPGDPPPHGTMADGECRALLGRGAHFKGTLAFEGFARVDGKLQGKILGAGLLTVGPDAEIEGIIQVSNLIVLGGRVRGEVRVAESIELAPGSDMLAEVEAEALYAAEGAMISGQWNLREKPVSLAIEDFPPWLEQRRDTVD